MIKKMIKFYLPALAGAFIAIAAPAANCWGKSNIIRIAAVGDIMLGAEIMMTKDGGAGVFSEAVPYFKNCQVVIGNLEGPLTDRGAPTKEVVEGRSYVFRTPPAYVRWLREAGFTVMSLANNHVNDYGPAGYAQTREVLEAAGLLYTGAIGQVARQKVGRTVVSVIGLAPNKGCQNLNDIKAAAELIRQESNRPNTLVVVVFHGGAEGPDRIYVPHGPEFYLGENRGDIRLLSRSLIDAGAHLVIGHGPHVPRGLEIYKDRLIAYSLGNFATGRGISIAGRSGLAPLLVVEMTTKGKLAGGRVVSFKQTEAGRPRLDSSGEAAVLMHSVSLADFTTPALSPEANLLTTETAAMAMAANHPKPPRPQLTAKAVSAASTKEKTVKSQEDQEKAKPGRRRSRSAGKNVTKASMPRYEWDVYSGKRH